MKYFFQALWIGTKNLALWGFVGMAGGIAMVMISRYPLEFFLILGTVVSIGWVVWKTGDLKIKADKKREREALFHPRKEEG